MDVAQQEKTLEATALFRKTIGGKGYVVEDVDSYIKTLREAYSDLEQEFASANKAAELAEEKAGKASRQCAEAEERTAALEAELASQRDGDREVRQELQRLQEKAAQLVREKEDLVGQVRTLQEGINEREEKMRIMADDLNMGGRAATELEETRRKLAEKESQLAAALEELAALREGTATFAEAGAEKYVSIFEYARSAADHYVDDVEKKMDALMEDVQRQADKLRSETQMAAEETVRRAQEEAEQVLKDAKIESEAIDQQNKLRQDLAQKKADETIRTAEERANGVLTRSREELAKIRALIQDASQEYLDLSAKKREEEFPL